MTRQEGFAILEVLLALAIMAALVIVALPNLQRYLAQRDLQQTARLLNADLRLAQQYAVTQGEPFRLQYTGAAAQYTVVRASDGTVVKQVDLPATIMVTGPFAGTPVEFAATGAPTQGGWFCLSDGTSILEVDVQPATGRSQVTEVPACP